MSISIKEWDGNETKLISVNEVYKQYDGYFVTFFVVSSLSNSGRCLRDYRYGQTLISDEVSHSCT